MLYIFESLLLIVCDNESIVNKTIVWDNNYSVFEFSTIFTRCKYFLIFVLKNCLSTLNPSRKVFMMMMMMFIFRRLIKRIIKIRFVVFIISGQTKILRLIQYFDLYVKFSIVFIIKNYIKKRYEKVEKNMFNNLFDTIRFSFTLNCCSVFSP
jgi:hypothetical protein